MPPRAHDIFHGAGAALAWALRWSSRELLVQDAFSSSDTNPTPALEGLISSMDASEPGWRTGDGGSLRRTGRPSPTRWFTRASMAQQRRRPTPSSSHARSARAASTKTSSTPQALTSSMRSCCSASPTLPTTGGESAPLTENAEAALSAATLAVMAELETPADASRLLDLGRLHDPVVGLGVGGGLGAAPTGPQKSERASGPG